MKYILKISLALFSLMLMFGCEKEGNHDITVDTELIEALSSSATYTLNIETDGPWTAEVLSSSGFYIKWMTISPSKGKGSASIKLQVKENDTYDNRTANVIITSGSGKSYFVKVKQNARFSGNMALVRLGNFNIRISPDTDYDTGNGWNVRKDRVFAAINNNDFDIWGFQEVSGPGNGGKVGAAMQQDFRDNLGDKYEFCFFSPYSQDGVGKSSNGIAYKKDKFIMSDYHYFWISETPEIMIRNDGTHSRGGCCAVFTHKATGVEFFFMEVHAPLDKDINNRLAYILPNLEKRYNSDRLPSVVVGDLNNYSTSDAYKTYMTWWADAYSVLLSANKVQGPSGTFNGFDTARDMDSAGRIDYILYRGNIEPVRYVCDDTLYGGYYPSDHLPIYCDFNISTNE